MISRSLPDVHLTNVAIQKKGDDYDADSGGKWDVRSLKLYLLAKYGADRVNTLFSEIQLICIRSLLSVQKVIISDKQSFEMYGYDIMIDSDLKPWLIEVNASPSLSANTPKDYQMKLALLHDTIAIVDMEKKSDRQYQTARTSDYLPRRCNFVNSPIVLLFLVLLLLPAPFFWLFDFVD